jgi:hypothetical protein
MTSPNSGAYLLDLRVDIDPCHSNAPVLNKVSGDIYQVYKWGFFKWYNYLRSWIIDDPVINWSRCSVGITGKVRFWDRVYLPMTASIEIPWLGYKIGPAKVIFQTRPWFKNVYVCKKRSNYFRDVKLEVDVCMTQDTPPIMPSYNTHAHTNRPPDIPKRTLTVEEAYKETGIDMTLNPVHGVVNDTANPSWTDRELHDAMEDHFSRYSGAVTTWNYWTLLASSYHLSSVAGVMFDYSVELPDRQGSAVFKNHSWFNNLPAGAPANDAEAAALRDFLYCYVHEIGHGFNLLHSWQKSLATPPQPDRPYSPAWMNYPWKYDMLPGNSAGDFWADFYFRFDDEELTHIRHGNRHAVIFGGEPFGEGAALSSFTETIGDVPLEVTLRSKGQFDYMEPVFLEIKVKNLTDTSVNLVKEMSPEFGATKIFIEKPSGATVEYRPVMCKLAETETLKVEPELSHYETIMSGFGKHGHYFREPGRYRVQAVYQGQGNVLLTSNIHEVIINPPLTSEEERAAAKYFTRGVGMALYLKGSDSPHLKDAMNTLNDVRQEFSETPVGAHLSVLLADNLSTPFHDVEDGKRTLLRDSKPDEAISLIDSALEQHEANQMETLHNITYHQAVRVKTDMLKEQKKKNEFNDEIDRLFDYLKNRGVKEHILARVEDYKKTY